MDMRSWNRIAGSLFLIASLATAAAQAESVSSHKREGKPRNSVDRPKLLFPKGTKKGDVIKSAVYDAERQVMVVEVESDNACNLREGFLLHEKSGRALFGPHIYSLNYGLRTMIGCGQRSTAKLEIPFDKDKAEGRIMIHLRGSDQIITADGTEQFPKKRMAESQAATNPVATVAPEAAGGRD